MIISAPRLFLGESLSGPTFSGPIFCGPTFSGPGAVRIEGGVITEIMPGETRGDIVLTHGFLSPGLIDIHNNGAFGVDCATAGLDDWDVFIAGLQAHGVTSVLPTIITAPL